MMTLDFNVKHIKKHKSPYLLFEAINVNITENKSCFSFLIYQDSLNSADSHSVTSVFRGKKSHVYMQ